MTTLSEAIMAKISPYPIVFSGTNVLLDPDRAIFPYENHWRGDYRSPYPMINDRRAGWRQRITYECDSYSKEDFKLPDGCFEYAPSTTIPCWEDGYRHRLFIDLFLNKNANISISR